MADNPSFEIGLVMAGAISAGAYTAGVVDFVFEALDAYEKAKASPGWDGPTHDVRIPVMAGASAGGMTSAISALHAYYDLEHVWPGAPPPAPKRNRLYSSWVTDISLDAFLETTDLEGGREAGGVLSLLCCDILDRIVNSAFSLDGPARERNWIGRGDDRTLRVMLTLSNVRGVPYSFPIFGANADERYGMLNHADYYDFAVGLANAAGGTLALDVEKFGNEAWSRYKTAALATGAFPVGLRPRIIERSDASWYTFAGCVGHEDPANDCFVPIPPDQSFADEVPYRFGAIDGGTIDNEPFEVARRYLAGRDLHNPRDGQDANKAVILVAPFPNFQKAPPFSDDLRLLHLLPRLSSMLIEQARFKPDELELAANDKIFSRFMISPIRTGNGSDAAIRYPIACGVMGGFGGFIHRVVPQARLPARPPQCAGFPALVFRPSRFEPAVRRRENQRRSLACAQRRWRGRHARRRRRPHPETEIVLAEGCGRRPASRLPDHPAGRGPLQADRDRAGRHAEAARGSARRSQETDPRARRQGHRNSSQRRPAQGGELARADRRRPRHRGGDRVRRAHRHRKGLRRRAERRQRRRGGVRLSSGGGRGAPGAAGGERLRAAA